MNVYKMDDEVIYNGIDYTILNTLEHGLLLVVETNDFKNRNYPLKSLVIPNEIV